MRIAQVSKTSETTPALAPYLITLAQYNSLCSIDVGATQCLRCLHHMTISGATTYVRIGGGLKRGVLNCRALLC